MESKKTVEPRLCHCGKCNVTCNKHGLIAVCDECGKRRRLGTEKKDGKYRHICNECCDKLIAAQDEEERNRISKKLRLKIDDTEFPTMVEKLITEGSCT